MFRKIAPFLVLAGVLGFSSLAQPATNATGNPDPLATTYPAKPRAQVTPTSSPILTELPASPSVNPTTEATSTEVVPDLPDEATNCVEEYNDDGLLEEVTCSLENGTKSILTIHHVAKFQGPQSVIDELQKTTSEPLGRYSSIFEYGDSYCFSRDYTFRCFDTVTNSLFTQTWSRAEDGHRVYSTPVPYSPNESD
ncbi:MAG: hypothetical protein EBR26_06065 [Microbacteriaceae bacterium]|jgi:hypothetical protein|nr:hypothetical protein [Microbacteriaceae bacterium]